MTGAAADALQHDKDDAARVVEAEASKHSRQDVQICMEQQEQAPPPHPGEINQLQSTVYKMYRHVWSM